ncbi:acyl-CoA thioesterase [Halorhabdus sp. CBA1104]|uniref:acyl-CoA thioesterase n=1 Tax=unclassified Halorhabdus TaxID=2621901 RepID=UPI0012B34AA0|nr:MULTISPECIES: acyl-CoA thioesterase [unclassified Halorhabdus]QGN08207.1 acyl-CoA thioesterase [Halorhabdus sp. CBA1104]
MPTISETYLENRWRVQPNHANNYGTVHGGNVMKWMDELGAMSAMRASGEPCVTASIDEMNFHRPVPTGDIVVIESYAYATGRTSVKVALEAAREDPATGDREVTTGSRFVFVAIDEDGSPISVPDLTAEGDRCKQLRERALERERDDD